MSVSSLSLADTDLTVGGRATRKSQGIARRAIGIFVHDRVAMTALVIVVALAAFALGADLIADWTGFTAYENHLTEKLSKPGCCTPTTVNGLALMITVRPITPGSPPKRFCHIL